MKKHLFIGLILALAGGIAAMLVFARKPGNVVHRGKPLKDWCVQVYRGDSNAVSELKSMGTNAIPGLIGLLQTRDSFFRKQLWSVLPKLPRRTRPMIVQRVAPPTAEFVREAAGRALGVLGSQAGPAVPALARALCDREGRVRQEAALALSQIGEEAVPALIEASADKSPMVRQAAAHALGQIGPDADAAIPTLVARLGDSNEYVRNTCAYALSMLGTSGVLALVDSVEEGHGAACDAATQRLGQRFLPLRNAWPGLLQMAKDENPATRRRAIEALARIRSTEGLAMTLSIEALKDPVVEVRLTAIKTLGSMGPNIEFAAPALSKCLKDESPSIREWTVWALGEIGPPARSAVPELTDLLRDSEESVRTAARSALGRIEPGASAIDPGLPPE